MIQNNEIKVGEHLIININDIETNLIYDHNYIIQLMNKIINLCDLTVLNNISHTFEPCGFTGIYLLSESHLSFHTWPEHNKICIDLFSCGKSNKTIINSFLEREFKNVNIHFIER